ncbi:hypothetical protein AJ79_08465 [Helicocarpus griseus UAMH5409]|uniref:DOMON domain-containing protein n=1 Tax=Helicocarpus griseus UAMH5409 TaxID=1447875 RepID=A0A2B7WS52_9EURO|nr:hypothetical protein AJ79_08465 [Helicocarpus griseus UAMH5409]
MRLFSTVVAAATLASVPMAHSQTAEFRPSEAPGFSYRVNIPPSTASSGQGPIFFQMEAPSDVQWFALGQGTGMIDSNIFIAYAASADNVTISPRTGIGHRPPQPNPSVRLQLLEGSGISNGKIIANVQCDNCLSWQGGSMNPSDNQSPWIWAMKRGAPLNSADVNEGITIHDNKGTFTVDLTQAAGGNGGSASEGTSQSNSIAVRRAAHGIIMSVVFVILFPSFALGLFVIPYSKTASRIHAPLQLLTLCATIAGFGIGVSLARDMRKTDMYHPIIGYVVIAWLVLCQPALGYLHHRNYVRTHERSMFGIVHRWGGRTILTLAIINGGLGFMFAGIGTEGVPKAGVIVYGAIAGFMGVVYMIVATWGTLRRAKGSPRADNEPFFGRNEMKTGRNGR